MDFRHLFRTKSVHDILREVAIREAQASADPQSTHLKKTLTVWDLTAFGIAAILGAGVFSTIGNAASEGGPAVIFLFIFTAIACCFSAFCYAEFASTIPISGSAYTYAYASFGELFAWIIGWDLLMEYAISNIAVAISWSQYFTGLLDSYGIHIPKFLTMDFLSAYRAHEKVAPLLDQGLSVSQIVAEHAITPILLRGYDAWIQAPRFFDLPIICDLPALGITFIITWIVYIGIEESKLASNAMVLIKLLVVLVVIGVGATYVQPTNWQPFAPHGLGGVMKGVAAVFFAYIGFDAISTTAEECKDPQRDLPRGMFYSLLICTTLYVLVALVLTGVVHYSHLAVGDPLAYVFGPAGLNLRWVSVLVGFGGVIALSTVLLVYQVGQPRIWMAMSRDGLLPPIFSAIHPKYRTPWFSTLLTGLLVAVPSLFLNLTEVTDLASIGTLFAFVLVCGGVLKLEQRPGQRAKKMKGKFSIPYINSKYIFPILALASFAIVLWMFPEKWDELARLPAEVSHGIQWDTFKNRIPGLIFSFGMVILSYFCFTRNFSLIPVLGLASCSYLISELGLTNWIRFGLWLIAGLIIYFFYGVSHSKAITPSASSA